MCDRLGDRRLVAIGLAILLAANLGSWRAETFQLLIAGRVVEGGGVILLSIGTAAMMIRTTSGARQSMAMSLFSTSVPLGVGLSIALAGQVAGEHWRTVFPAFSLLLGGALLLVRFTPAWDASPELASAERAGWRTVLRHAPARRLALGILSATVMMFGFGALFPSFASETYRLSTAQAAGFGLLSYPASIIGSFTAGTLLARLSADRLIIAGLALLGLAGAGIFVPALGLAPVAILLFAFYVVSGMVSAIGLSRLPLVSPSASAIGATTGLVLQASNLGIVIAPPLAYGIWQHGGSVGMGALSLMCAGLTAWAWRFGSSTDQKRSRTSS